MEEIIQLEERVEKICTNLSEFLEKSLISAKCDVSLSLNIIVTCSEEDIDPIFKYCESNSSAYLHDMKKIGEKCRIEISIQ